MSDLIWGHLLDGAVVSVLGVFTFLVRSFFSRISSDLKELQSLVDKLGGRLDAIQNDIHRNTVETAVMKQELRAVWRFVDAEPRASDVNGGSER